MLPQTLVPYIGLAAAFVTTFCWLPQAIHIIRTRDTRAISLPAYGAFTVGIALWLVYGIALGDLPLILSNTVTLGLQLVIVGLKLRYG
ncbi:MAG: SemiSWEET transporter [Phreatobacter sp.]|uniref:SemiSWEET family sugar transporter n=1 Tax=Phreatobacter sp. TaxID=1966341 RepID=UPI00273558F2|nr:SemiSWEET transporter [Phreatobacter sp.]MDP2802257.1 SemiSWEET transporter [Phreatobacter sp.]